MNRFSTILFLPILLLLLIYSCSKDKNPEPKTAPGIKEFVLKAVLNNAAKFAISTKSGDFPLLETGVCWDTIINPVIKGDNVKRAEPTPVAETVSTASKYGYKCIVPGLSLETQYYARAYAISEIDTVYSDNQIPFQTESSIDTFNFAGWVRYEGLDCFGAFVIYIYGFDKNSNIQDGMYYADRLSSEFKIPGLKVQLNCREPAPGELYPCSMRGPTFLHVIITGCKKVQE